MRLVLKTANVVSDAKNCLYPNRMEAGNAEELQEAIKKDHPELQAFEEYDDLLAAIKEAMAE